MIAWATTQGARHAELLRARVAALAELADEAARAEAAATAHEAPPTLQEAARRARAAFRSLRLYHEAHP